MLFPGCAGSGTGSAAMLSQSGGMQVWATVWSWVGAESQVTWGTESNSGGSKEGVRARASKLAEFKFKNLDSRGERLLVELLWTARKQKPEQGATACSEGSRPDGTGH